MLGVNTGLFVLSSSKSPPFCNVYQPLNEYEVVKFSLLLTVAPFDFLEFDNSNPLTVYSFCGTTISSGLISAASYVTSTLAVGLFVAPFLFKVIV